MAATAILGSLSPVGYAWAQGAATAPPPAGSSWSGSAIVAGGAIVAVLLLVTVLLVKMFDLRRKREMQAVHLQAQVADALLRDPVLFRLPITPTAHVPLWRGTPAVVELAGQVSSEAELRAALRLVQQEAMRVRADVRFESRIGIVPALAHRVA